MKTIKVEIYARNLDSILEYIKRTGFYYFEYDRRKGKRVTLEIKVREK